MLLLGFVPMFVLLLIVAFCFTLGSGDNADVPLVGVFGILYIIAYSPTAGPTPFAISAEVFPLVVREVGHSMAVAVNFIGLGIVLLVFPSLSNAMSGNKDAPTEGYKDSLSLFVSIYFQQLLWLTTMTLIGGSKHFGTRSLLSFCTGNEGQVCFLNS
jgi:Sugar (and other) transporter